MKNFHLIIVSIIILILTGCTSQEETQETLIIFAAASLTEAFTTIGETFEQEFNAEVELNFSGSQSLRLQIEQGAQADIFASANQQYAEALQAAGLIQEPVIFTHNQLIVILPAANPASLHTLADLTQPDLRLVLAGPDVPVGRYARQALENLNNDSDLGPDFSDQVLKNVVSEEDNVKAVVTKVQLGEADAGIVYRSDSIPSVADDLHTIEIPAEYNISADYPIALMSSTETSKLGQQFIDFVRSEQGQAILTAHGFQSLQP